jgi:SAM-dependent methyltransferase
MPSVEPFDTFPSCQATWTSEMPYVKLVVVAAETHFDEWVAQNYSRLWPELLGPDLLDAAVDVLAELAGAGNVLEFGIGTGRVALPLSRRGVRVSGIELSQPMVDELRRQGGTEIDVAIGDFANVRLDGRFSLVYLLRNTITNLTTLDEQVAAFANAARHLEPGGYFVVENYIPQLQRLPPEETRHVFVATADHVGIEEYDLATQIAVSRHWWMIDAQLKTFASPHRYVWPSELDLMAKMAGMTPGDRWANWHRQVFTANSPSHISVWQIPDTSLS